MSAYSKQLPAFSNLAQAAAEMQIEQTYTQLKKKDTIDIIVSFFIFCLRNTSCQIIKHLPS